MSKDGAKKRAVQGRHEQGRREGSAQSKDGMSKDGTKDSAQSKDGMSKDGTKNGTKSKDGTTADSQVGRQRSQTTGNAATSATAAPPAEKRTQIRPPSGRREHQGNHQRQLQYLGRHAGSEFGPLPSASAADRRDLSGMARLPGHPGQRPLRHRSAPDPRDRLHHRGLTAGTANYLRAIRGGQRCPPLSRASIAGLWPSLPAPPSSNIG